ncbi:hypothetical protein IT575_02035 [bacterium]|nr:hypothetical protein [bacterium]
MPLQDPLPTRGLQTHRNILLMMVAIHGTDDESVMRLIADTGIKLNLFLPLHQHVLQYYRELLIIGQLATQDVLASSARSLLLQMADNVRSEKDAQQLMRALRNAPDWIWETSNSPSAGPLEHLEELRQCSSNDEALALLQGRVQALRARKLPSPEELEAEALAYEKVQMPVLVAKTGAQVKCSPGATELSRFEPPGRH